MTCIASTRCTSHYNEVCSVRRKHCSYITPHSKLAQTYHERVLLRYVDVDKVLAAFVWGAFLRNGKTLTYCRRHERTTIYRCEVEKMRWLVSSARQKEKRQRKKTSEVWFTSAPVHMVRQLRCAVLPNWSLTAELQPTTWAVTKQIKKTNDGAHTEMSRSQKIENMQISTCIEY